MNLNFPGWFNMMPAGAFLKFQFVSCNDAWTFVFDFHCNLLQFRRRACGTWSFHGFDVNFQILNMLIWRCTVLFFFFFCTYIVARTRRPMHTPFLLQGVHFYVHWCVFFFLLAFINVWLLRIWALASCCGGGEECSYVRPLAGLWIKTSGVFVVFLFVLLFPL